MASEPEQRHASAQELGRAVEAYLEGSERRAGETRRRRIAALGLLVLVAVLAVTSSAFFRLWKQAEVARTEADARTLLAESRRHVASSSIEEAVALARAALTLQGGGPAGEVSAAQLDLELLGPGSAVVFEHELDRRDTAGLLVASPDRTLLALGSRKGRVELLDASGAAQLRLPDQDGKIEHLVFWPDGSRLVTSASGQPVRVWDVDSGELLRQLGERSVDPSVLTLRGIDETLVTARGSELVFWAADGEPAEIVQTQERAVSAVVFGIDGVLMAVLGDDASVWLSRASPPIERFVLKTPDRTRLLAWSPASDRIATAGAEGSLNLWHTDTDAGAMLLQAAGSRVEGLVFSPDGALLATSSDAEVQVWRTADGALVRQLVGHAEPITRMTFSSASDRLATADVGRHVRIWDMATGRTDKVWRGTGLRGLLNGLVWLPSDQEIVVAAGNTVLGLNAQLVSPQELLAASAEWTTFLVCRDTLTPAAAGGAYDPLTVWAPPERCALSPAILGLTRGYGIAEPDSDERPPPGPPSARGADAPGVPHRLCVMVDDQSAPQLDTRPGWEGEMRPAHPPGACSDGGVTDRWRTVRLDRTEPELHIVVLGGAGPFRGELQRVPLPPEWGADHASACLALTLRLDEDGRVQPAPLVEPLYEYVDGRCR
jgi:hypothetical protein